MLNERNLEDIGLQDSRTHARLVGGARDKKYLFWNGKLAS